MAQYHKCEKYMCANYIATHYKYSARRARHLASERSIEHDHVGPRKQKLWAVGKLKMFAPKPNGRPPTGRVKR